MIDAPIKKRPHWWAKYPRSAGEVSRKTGKPVSQAGPENSQSTIANSQPWRTGLPDSDVTVLMRLEDPEYPVWPGFYDADRWLNADASEVKGRVLGWMHLEEAARVLDGGARE